MNPAFVYTGISLGAAMTFFVAAWAQGRYEITAIYGGTFWVFLLSMIVTMPIVIPFMKKRAKGSGSASDVGSASSATSSVAR